MAVGDYDGFLPDDAVFIYGQSGPRLRGLASRQEQMSRELYSQAYASIGFRNNPLKKDENITCPNDVSFYNQLKLETESWLKGIL